jgi:hypothetical protein
MLSCGLGAEELGHERDDEGLRDRLIEADRQRRVLVSERGQEEGHEAVPRNLAHRGQHAFVEGETELATDSPLPFLHTYRTMCLSPNLAFLEIIEQVRALRIAA